MTEHKHPDAFPEHLRAHLLPMPETPKEAFELLLLFLCADRRGSNTTEMPDPPPEIGRGRNGGPEK
jgi:hypothetical protein